MNAYVATDAEAYELSMGRWSRRLAGSFLSFALPGGTDSVLDLGCGTGSLSAAVLDRWPEVAVTGIDLSAAYLVEAARRCPGQRFLSADAHQLPLSDASVGAAVSLLVLNFLDRPEAAVAEMVRVTRPGGFVAAAVWDFRGGMPFLRLMADVAATLRDDGHAFRSKLFSGPLTAPGELAAEWHRHGLRDVQDASLTIRMEFADFADYWTPWLTGQGVVGAYVNGLSAKARERLAYHLEQAYRAGGYDGPRSFTATAWAVRGRVSGALD